VQINRNTICIHTTPLSKYESTFLIAAVMNRLNKYYPVEIKNEQDPSPEPT
jgi:hypothetical protein